MAFSSTTPIRPPSVPALKKKFSVGWSSSVGTFPSFSVSIAPPLESASPSTIVNLAWAAASVLEVGVRLPVGVVADDYLDLRPRGMGEEPHQHHRDRSGEPRIEMPHSELLHDCERLASADRMT
jgi:hypothetical protein